MDKRDTVLTAEKHSIRKDIASPDFFEGAVMGNGNLGLIVCTRPDAVVLHLGHNSIWDIRVEEGHKKDVGTFDEIWGKIINDKESFKSQQWFTDYCGKMASSYSYPYPRPFPASSTYLFFDRKEYEVTGHELDISKGLLTIKLEDRNKNRFFINIIVSMTEDTVYCRTTDVNDSPVSIFYRMRIIPHAPDNGLPDYKKLENGFIQLLPANGFNGDVREGTDKGFSVLYRLNGTALAKGLDTRLEEVNELSLHVTEGFFSDVEKVREFCPESFEDVFSENIKIWHEYWERSGVRIADEFLEDIWYKNTYFIRCVLSPDSCCPGLFGNWMFGNIGTAWHGDYHMNYNTQQPFWGLMSSNRQDLHFPYIGLVERLLPVSESWARDFYHLDGACFPHSAYPVTMTINPYPVPNWGWEIFETPWTVQSLWWHYTYTCDKELLRTRIYPLIRAAAVFLAEYMTREGSNPENDEKYHIYPTIVPELYGLTEGLKMNIDGAVDLTFTKFIFKAVLQAVNDLGLKDSEKDLTSSIRRILDSFPDYPVAEGKHGTVFVSVKNEDPDKVIYNTPANLMQIFPGEDIDTAKRADKQYEIACNSWRYHYNEGGNDLVFYYLMGARLGILDIEQFKRHVRYCLMSNGIASDRVTLSGGRYGDAMNFDFMSRMGIWVENLSLYAVVNECFLRGHTDTIVLFPNWDLNCAAEFCSLRTKGAFLVDAACANGTVTGVKITSELGGKVKLENPWEKAVDQYGTVYDGKTVEIMLAKNDVAVLREKTH